jgi:Fe-coproporphyrin III synthase
VHIGTLLSQGKSVAEISQHIAEEYDIPLSTARRDVMYVADSFTQLGFLSPCHKPVETRAPHLAELFVHLTSKCNLRCAHCYTAGGAADFLSTVVVKKMIDEAAELGGESVTFSGGEPLLHPQIKDLFRHASRKMSVSLLTNGTLIDREWALYLSSLRDVRVQISLDGPRREVHDFVRGKGAFDRTLKAIELLQNAGLGDRIVISTTIMKNNIHGLGDIMGLAENLGVPLVRFLPLRRKGRAVECWEELGAGLSVADYEAFFDEALSSVEGKTGSVRVSCGLSGFLLNASEDVAPDGFWCPVGRKLVVDAKGDVFPCVLMMSDGFLLGNVYQDTLPHIMASEKVLTLCKALAERRARIETCSPCLWRNFCQAGCMGEALDEKGTIWDTDPFCSYRKKAYGRACDRLLARPAIREGRP